MKILVLILALAVTASAQQRSNFLRPLPVPPKQDIFRPFGPMTILATSACSAGQMSDVISSTGMESNGFLRGSNGKLNVGKAVPLKFATCIVPALFDKKLPRSLRVTVRVLQFFGGGLGFYDAARNWKNNRK